MLNAVNKSLIAAIVVMAGALGACSDKEQEGAEALYGAAETQIGAAQYQQALATLDTLNARYPEQTGVRRQALRLRALAMQGLALDSISAGSEALAAATIERESRDPKFRHVDSNVGLEGYFLPKGVSEKVMTSTCIQPRVSDKGFFYIVANVQGKSIGLRSIEFVDGAETASSSPLSPARVIKVEGSESASFNPEDLEGIGEWLLSHPGASKVIIRGSKSNASVKLDAKLRSQLVDCYEYSRALQNQRLARLKREKYERMLATARDQLANLPQPEDKQ
ncbi:MAG: hypothetical protein K2L75_08825 [Muribaculaceae bacterium]|nr:hypothetical protein [Muribaculaceae bacterium]MDE6612889.1 hypothetical protein [Muribaculaceae bacterium]